ncbi:MAG TPA: hypothetical protein VH478_18510 [Trebonia sp.]|nr:hypothetical protein [Trebonia sp.]
MAVSIVEVSAVIDDYREAFGELRAQPSQGENPVDRLKAMLQALTERRGPLATYSCRIGSLSCELGKRGIELPYLMDR